MAASEVDVLAIERGAITAPAGCGKTHLIADGLTRHESAKPILVLTHTNAGVAALRGKLDKLNVPPRAYRVTTIDGWAMRLISMFPTRSAQNQSLLRLANPATDYPNIRVAAAKLLKAGHINDLLRATYDRIIVDEYQDCSVRQHALVTWAAKTLSTVVLGDPLQAIFGFGSDDLADWNDVIKFFPVSGQLQAPWRWINAGAEQLGRWLLEVRERLLRGEVIDLRQAPTQVEWVELDGTNDHSKRLTAGRVQGPGRDPSVLIIGDSTNPASQRQFASQIPGAVTVEAVDLRDLVAFAQRFDVNGPNALPQLVQFAESVLVNFGAADFIDRINAIGSGSRALIGDSERVALDFVQRPNHLAAVEVLVELGKLPGVRAHRPAVLRACIRTLQLCSSTEGLGLHDTAIRMREQNRLVGRPLPKRSVGSTLLLKGLEGDVAVILNADSLNSSNLYVAMTRGSKKLVVCSASSVLKPD